ncbi:GumC family protein [Desulfobacca acetoxidans]
MNKPKNFHYYIYLFKRKKLYLFLSVILIFFISFLIAYLLPTIYESSSTILIEEQQIPPDLVRTTVTGFADERIQSITQQILSRTKLWEIIKQMNLYQNLREKFTQEEIIDKMRNDIAIDTISADLGQKGKRSGKDSMTIAFTIAYRGQNPAVVQKVAGNLASLYLEQNLKDRQEKAETTTKFLEAELRQLEEQLSSIGNKVSDFKGKHEHTLPELKAHNLSQAERLENEIKQIDNQLRAIVDRKTYLEGQLATINPDLPIVGQESVMDPKARLYMLRVMLQSALANHAEDHPDVRKIRREIVELEKLVGAQGGSASVKRQKLAALQLELAEKQGKLTAEHPEIKKLQKTIAQLEQEKDVAEVPARPILNPNNPSYIGINANIQAADNEIAMLKKQQADLREKVKIYRERLEATPKIEQEYIALMRDYQNSHNKYQEVMNKLLTARIAEGMEEHQKAEKFTLIDPASFPEKPVSPNRILIMAVGLLLGLAAGVGLVIATDQLDQSVKDADELAWLTELPILGTISSMQHTEEVNLIKKRRWIILAASGLSLLLVIVFLHFFYMDLWVVTARLLRLANKSI